MNFRAVHCLGWHLTRGVGAAVFCLIPCAGFAGDDLAYLDLSLEELLEVPITGSTLTEETLKTVPAAVSVFTREQIDRLGMDYLYELLNLVPGFQFNRNANNGVAYTFSARGRRSSQQSVEVLLLIDGHAVNDPRAGSPDISLPLYPLARIERLEVIRGPGSAIYGSSAFTGVINIVTRKQQKSLSFAYGSLERRQVKSLWAAALGDWALDGFIQAYEDMGDEFVVPDTFNRQPLATRDPRQQAGFDATLTRAQTRFHVNYSRVQTEDFYQSGNTANDYNANERQWHHLALDQGFSWLPDTQSKVSVSYQKLIYDFKLYLAAPGQLLNISNPRSAEPFEGDARVAGESWGFTFTNDWAIDEQSSAQWGIQGARHQETDASALANFDLVALSQRVRPITYYGDQGKVFSIGTEDSREYVGVFSQYLRNLRDSTRLTLGGRYDYYAELAGRFSPRLGVVEQLDETYSLKLLYGQAFRAPTLSETGIINNPLLLGNADLSHEIVKTWDLILMGNWKATNFSVGVFENHYEQPIETAFVGTARTYRNGSGESSQGVEVEWAQELSIHWSLRSTYTYMDLPASAFREAAQIGSFEINYAAEKWSWNLLGYYQDERDTPITQTSVQTLDDFWILNTQWRYQFSGGYELKLIVKNIADEASATPFQSLGSTTGTPNRGRELSAEVEWRF